MKKLVLSHHAVVGSLALLSLTWFCQAFGQDCCQMSNGCISSNKTPRETAAASCRQQGGTPVTNAECINRRCVQRGGRPAYEKVEATELRTTVAQLQPRNAGLKTEFERKITLAEANASRGNHPAAARALTSIGTQVFRTPDSELSNKEKIEVFTFPRSILARNGHQGDKSPYNSRELQVFAQDRPVRGRSGRRVLLREQKRKGTLELRFCSMIRKVRRCRFTEG